VLGKRISVERYILYGMMLCTVVDTVGVLQNYTATTLTTSFIVPHPIIRDQPREGGREKLMEEIGKKRERIRPT
jgi:hypothetical protein